MIKNSLRFFLFLLAHLGMEINTTKESQETGIERHVIDENMLRLAITDMTVRIPSRQLQVLSGHNHRRTPCQISYTRPDPMPFLFLFTNTAYLTEASVVWLLDVHRQTFSDIRHFHPT